MASTAEQLKKQVHRSQNQEENLILSILYLLPKPENPGLYIYTYILSSNAENLGKVEQT